MDVGHVALSGTCRACRERAGSEHPHDAPPSCPAPARSPSRAASVAAHYGDPLREQRLLAEGAGLVDRSDRDVLVVPGADRLSWLHSLTSQHLDRLADGTGSEALVLSPHGHVEHHLVLAELGGTTWADVEPGTGRGAARFLDRMRFMLRVEPALVTDAVGRALRLVGPEGRRGPGGRRAAGPGAAVRGRRRSAAASSAACRRSATAARRCSTWSSPRAELGAWPTGCWRRCRSAGLQAYEALRVEARRPRLGVDTDHRTIPNELSWLRTAVHLDKGCYRGQETVARVHNLGRPPRRLVLLHLDGVSEVLAEPGTPVLAGDPRGRPGRHASCGTTSSA